MRRTILRCCLAILVLGFCRLDFSARAADTAADKETLRYDGKPFEYWRTYMRTELKAERRIDAIRALAAFGVRGHAQSAATAIVEAIKDYGADAYGGNAKEATPEQKLLQTAIEAIVKIGPTGFEIVLRHAKDANIRRFAVGIYSHSFQYQRVNVLSASAVRTLLAYVQEGDIETRQFAVSLLGEAIRDYPPSKDNALAVLRAEKDTTRLVRALIEMLLDEDKYSYFLDKVIETLGPRAKAAASALVKARLWGHSIDDRTFKAIGVEAKELIPDIAEGLKSQKAEVRTIAAEWLGKMGSQAKPALPALLQALRNFPKPATGAVKSGDPIGGSPLEEYEKARLAAIESLGCIGAEPQKVVPVLAEIIANDEETRSYRLAAANALMKFGSQAKEAAPVLLKIFANDGEQDEVRSSALRALEQIGVASRQVIPLLIVEIDKRSREAQSEHNHAANDLTAQSIAYLVKLRPQAREALPVLMRAFKHYHFPEEIRLRIPQALGEMGPSARDALPALREQAKSRDAALRKAATAAIEKIDKNEPK